mgnify:CR=1 FL=1
MTEMDYTQFNIQTFDLVSDPGLTTANFVVKNYIRKKKIKNLFSF